MLELGDRRDLDIHSIYIEISSLSDKETNTLFGSGNNVQAHTIVLVRQAIEVKQVKTIQDLEINAKGLKYQYRSSTAKSANSKIPPRATAASNAFPPNHLHCSKK